MNDDDGDKIRKKLSMATRQTRAARTRVTFQLLLSNRPQAAKERVQHVLPPKEFSKDGA